MVGAYRYHANFLEHHTMDGRELMVRALQPGEAHTVADLFARLSPQSRYWRFFGTKHALSVDDLRRLTAVDPDTHLALAVVASDGRPATLAIARCVRDSPTDPCAEVSLAVADAYQGRGLGRLLLAHLVLAAQERGITRLSLLLMPDNTRMRTLLAQPNWSVRFARDHELLIAELPVPEVARLLRHDAAGVGELVAELFRVVAEGIVAVPLSAGLAASDLWWRRTRAMLPGRS